MSVYIDSNVLISALTRESRSVLAVKLLEESDAGKVSLVCSVIMFGEVLHNGKSMLAKEFLLRAPVTYVDVDTAIMLKVAELRIDNAKLKVPDAIHLATALTAGCIEMITDDSVLKKVASKYIECRGL